MTFEIVKPQLKDVGSLASLWHPTFILHHDIDPDYYVPDSASLVAHLHDYLTESISSGKRQVRCAKAPDGQFLGLVIFWEDEENHFDTNIRKFVVIGELYVDVSARKKNVGQALMNAAEDFARTQGFRYVKLMASKHNDTALRFYERIGYSDRQRLLFKDLG